MGRTSLDRAEWFLRTASKADQARCKDKKSWDGLWQDTYRELGGSSISVAKKECPKNAAYGLWFLGRVKSSMGQRIDLPVREVDRQLGKNSAYAVIAADLLAGETDYSRQQLWDEVRRAYAAATGKTAALSEQGQISLVLALAKRGALAKNRAASQAGKA